MRKMSLHRCETTALVRSIPETFKSLGLSQQPAFSPQKKMLGCSSNQIDQEKIAADMEIILTQIFDLIKNGDKETFKTYFADDALNVSDFEDGWNFLLTQYKGDLLNIDCKFPMGEGTRFVPGERIQTAFTTFNIITNENEYVAYIDFYTQYSSKYPEGSYKIRIFKLLTKHMLDDGENFHDCSLRYGIYYPGWPVPEVN